MRSAAERGVITVASVARAEHQSKCSRIGVKWHESGHVAVMSPLRRAITVLLLASLGALSALVLGACGSDDIFGDDADEQVKVSVNERDLDPGRVVVNAGKIEFEVRNDGKRVHAFAVNTKDGVERTETIKPGESA